jgi:hypothetical protein
MWDLRWIKFHRGKFSPSNAFPSPVPISPTASYLLPSTAETATSTAAAAARTTKTTPLHSSQSSSVVVSVTIVRNARQ